MESFKSTFFVILALSLTACNSTYQSEQIINSIVDNSTVMTGITEQTAFEWLLIDLKRQQVADLDCLKFRIEGNEDSDVAEDTIAAVWDFAAIEIHDENCGGDPSITHVRDRYQISSDGSVKVYDVKNAHYKPL
ncbi:hypothetical protein ACT3TH_08965 [Psychrobacter sp. AOP22-C1-C5]|uniref:hypothetical protein n=1 Tax=Psychrobacter sp. AOP22-C1-C5 TaxID=3457716 RepID=UPI0040375015